MFDTLRKDCVGAYGKSPEWGEVDTPHLNAFAKEALVFDRLYPEVLPTLPVRRALYTGQRVYPFVGGDHQYKGDEVFSPGWGPVLESQTTVAEMFQNHDYRTCLISDLYHQFKPSKNFHRGFDQWTYLRGQEIDRYRSGPQPTSTEIDHWLSPEIQGEDGNGVEFMRRCLTNMHGRFHEEDYFNARVMSEASRWLHQNDDAEQFFLTIECFDPHEPWFVPEHYRRMYDDADEQEHVLSTYAETDSMPKGLLNRARMNYSGLVTMCDRWFGHLYQTLDSLGRLDDTVVVVASDHGHSLGERNYMGKRGYPSAPEVLEGVLMIRHPDGLGAGQRSDSFLQHTDISAQLLDFAGITPEEKLHGQPFWQAALNSGPHHRQDVTVGWGNTITVINDNWWMNCFVDGSGPILHDLNVADPFEANVAESNQEVVQKLFAQALAEAGGEFSEYLLKQSRTEDDTPHWNPLARQGEAFGII
jgi:arylsulfatase A-like enzyme